MVLRDEQSLRRQEIGYDLNRTQGECEGNPSAILYKLDSIQMIHLVYHVKQSIVTRCASSEYAVFIPPPNPNLGDLSARW